MTLKNNIKWSFQPVQWLSSAEEERGAYSQDSGFHQFILILELIKGIVMAENFDFLSLFTSGLSL